MKTYKQLEVLSILQHQFPELMLGGSFNAMLRGFNLGRSLETSDLDLIAPEKLKNKISQFFADSTVVEQVSNFEDFELAYKHDSGFKIEIHFDNAQKPEIVEYMGKQYVLSPFEKLLAKKIEYAAKGVSKHSDDLKNMIIK